MISEFHPAARDELVATVEYYELALPGLGRRFRNAVASALSLIEEYPDSGAPIPSGFRRAAVSGFPYDVVYRARGGILHILALAHHRRRPGYWRARSTN